MMTENCYGTYIMLMLIYLCYEINIAFYKASAHWCSTYKINVFSNFESFTGKNQGGVLFSRIAV